MPNARRSPKAVRNLDAGPLQADIDLFELELIQENKAPKTRRTCIEATQWFAAEQLLPDVEDWSGSDQEARPALDGQPAHQLLRLLREQPVLRLAGVLPLVRRGAARTGGRRRPSTRPPPAGALARE